MSKFLEVRNLSVNFPTEDGIVKAVDNLSFSLERGKTLGVVGESGSGKTMICRTMIGTLERRGGKILSAFSFSQAVITLLCSSP